MTNTEVPTLSLLDGNTIPQLGLGTFLMQGETCESIVAEALAVGYRHIDTAMVYQNEEEVGRAIAASGIARDDLFVTTKLANTEQTDPIGGFERSLDRLGLDGVDLYLLHWPLPKRDTALPAWEGIVKIAESGRARSIGVCNFEIEHLEQIIDATGVVPAVNQIELHPENQRKELVDYCTERGIIIESWGPLAQGKSDLLSREAVLAAAQAHGKTPGQVVLRWHVERGAVVIPKTQTPARLTENAAIFDFALSPAEHQAIDELESATNYGPDPRSYDG
ncbi:aldo/keto reductase [Leucobacter chinensis]|uniref:aldo/keto reductase n=1 Tax=Leucobacter chinensis TaxID=2851010 RepID=UPI001C21A9ED|nr:aldo/keto reductase [Leucobacter chinensis]